ncbi:MAG: hypothetical protein ACKV2Q_11160 [Planctomycetaceae bacterium]
MSRYLTVAAVADQISLSVPAVLALIHRAEIVASNVSIGTHRPRWRIADEELTRWLTSRQSGPTPRITRRRRSAAITEYV